MKVWEVVEGQEVEVMVVVKVGEGGGTRNRSCILLGSLRLLGR